MKNTTKKFKAETKIDENNDQHRPPNRPTLTHIAQMLMVMDRPDPNSNVQYCAYMGGFSKTAKTRPTKAARS